MNSLSGDDLLGAWFLHIQMAEWLWIRASMSDQDTAARLAEDASTLLAHADQLLSGSQSRHRFSHRPRAHGERPLMAQHIDAQADTVQTDYRPAAENVIKRHGAEGWKLPSDELRATWRGLHDVSTTQAWTATGSPFDGVDGYDGNGKALRDAARAANLASGDIRIRLLWTAFEQTGRRQAHRQAMRRVGHAALGPSLREAEAKYRSALDDDAARLRTELEQERSVHQQEHAERVAAHHAKRDQRAVEEHLVPAFVRMQVAEDLRIQEAAHKPHSLSARLLRERADRFLASAERHLDGVDRRHGYAHAPTKAGQRPGLAERFERWTHEPVMDLADVEGDLPMEGWAYPPAEVVNAFTEWRHAGVRRDSVVRLGVESPLQRAAAIAESGMWETRAQQLRAVFEADARGAAHRVRMEARSREGALSEERLAREDDYRMSLHLEAERVAGELEPRRQRFELQHTRMSAAERNAFAPLPPKEHVKARKRRGGAHARMVAEQTVEAPTRSVRRAPQG